MLSSIKRFFERTLTTSSPIIREPTLHPSGTGIANPTTPTPPPTGVTVGPITVPAAPIPTITSVPTTPASSPPVSAPSVPETVARLKQVGPTIAFINLSTVITDQQLSAAVAAMQIQLDRDFAPAWKTTANLMTIPNGSQPPSDSWIIYIMDTTDQAGALGYHDLTKEGNPLGKVFAKDDQKYGLSWTVTASHEVMEMLIDPYIQNTVFSQTSNTTGTLYALEVADACLTGDTLIPLLNGKTCRMDELVGQDEFFVYSTTETGEIKPGRGHSARVTQKNAEIIELVFDNGQSLKCTPDHLVMLRDGSYREAGKLSLGASLMPLYRQKTRISEKNNLEYEQVFNLASNSWKFTHRIVEVHCPKGSVRHHIDFNRFNNDPTNIQVMTWEDHQRVHQEAIAYVRQLPQSIAARKRNLAAFNATTKGTKRPELCVPHNISEETRDASRKRGREQLLRYNGSPEHLAAITENKNLEALWKDETFRAAHVERTLKRGTLATLNKTIEHREMLQSVFATAEFKQAASSNAKRVNHQRWHEKRNKPSPNCDFCIAKTSSTAINHKLVEIRSCERADVYDITVDDYHNFAVAAGVFVHNCEDDSFGYMINNVLVSDFVYPTWFEDFRPPNSTRFDHMHVINAPLKLAKGGYIGIFPVPNTTGWTQRLADKLPARLKIRDGAARTMRRGPVPLAKS